VKIYVRHLPGFGYVVEKDRRRIAERPYDRCDASSITAARNEAETLRSSIMENPARALLLTG